MSGETARGELGLASGRTVKRKGMISAVLSRAIILTYHLDRSRTGMAISSFLFKYPIDDSGSQSSNSTPRSWRVRWRRAETVTQNSLPVAGRSRETADKIQMVSNATQDLIRVITRIPNFAPLRLTLEQSLKAPASVQIAQNKGCVATSPTPSPRTT